MLTLPMPLDTWITLKKFSVSPCRLLWAQRDAIGEGLGEHRGFSPLWNFTPRHVVQEAYRNSLVCCSISDDHYGQDGHPLKPQPAMEAWLFLGMAVRSSEWMEMAEKKRMFCRIWVQWATYNAFVDKVRLSSQPAPVPGHTLVPNKAVTG